jgi:DNA-binding NarL/FixJ family response regulator
VRVLIVDDQVSFHDAARALIDATAGFEWIGSASSGEEGIDQVERLHPDLVLMDVRMPGMGGVEAARLMARRDARAVVVLVTAEDPRAELSAGAAATVVSKRTLTRSLLARLWAQYG